MNPLLKFSENKFNSFNFAVLKNEHFLPALDEALTRANERLRNYKNGSEVSFKACIADLQNIDDEVSYVSGIFFPLHSAHCTDEISQIAPDFSQKLTNFYSDLSLDAEIFKRVKSFYDVHAKHQLTKEEFSLMDKMYKEFIRNGALLEGKDKQRFKEIDERLSKLSLDFSENVRKSTAAFEMHLTEEKDLVGLPDFVLEMAAETAKARGHEAGYCFTLEGPSLMAFLTYSQNRERRKEIALAGGKRAYKGEFDNLKISEETLFLRQERASMLGFKNHAEYVLANRMAKDIPTVTSFLNQMSEKAWPAALRDIEKLRQVQQKHYQLSEIERFDIQHLSEILKKEELDFNDEMLKPYFKLENVVAGVFGVASKLYQLDFEIENDLAVYHPDVKVYKVTREGEYIGLFYTDFFPRKEKSPGAWMTDFLPQGKLFDKVQRPHIMIVCNFTKPTSNKPSLLTLDEVSTLFHEFGHALHGLLSKCTYRNVAGTNVLWDFVELPSQIMENWVLTDEALALFAKHYETGEIIPKNYIEKIKKSKQFLEGLSTIRQMSFSILDMQLHTTDPKEITAIDVFEKSILEKLTPYPLLSETCASVSFGHIFSGGYAAGYYSYKWAEVLDADAFSYFEEKGIFNHEVATKFRENILEKGSSEDPMELFKKFRGREPDVNHLLKRAGLL